MYNLSITNNLGETLKLTHNSSYTIINIEGLTPPKASINTSFFAGGDGAGFNSARMDTRNIVLTIAPEIPVERNRINLYRFFQVKRRVTIAYSNGTRNVVIDGYVESVEGNLFSSRQSIDISIICLQPYFKDAMTIISDLSRILSNFEFPFDITEEGTEISIFDPIYAVNVKNNGDAPNGVTITLFANGEVVNPIIYNVNTRDEFALNFTMQKGDLITIDTNRGYKSVILTRLGINTNLINKVKKFSTWFTIDVGENLFTYDADVGADLLDISFHHVDLYEGV